MVKREGYGLGLEGWDWKEGWDGIGLGDGYGIG